MSKQANTKLIGGFVVGAIVLAVTGILLFGSGKFYSHREKFVLFFEDSVKGLNIGAAVDFRGVNIGSVKEIKVVVAKDGFSLLIPVFIEIDLDRITFESAESKLIQHVELGTYIQLLIDNGLKAQLSMQSLITGQLGIHLDFYPDRPIRLVGAEPSYMEIPTIESGLSALSKTLENLPLAEIADKFEKTLDAIEKLATSPDLKQSLVSFHQTFDEAHVFLLHLDSEVKPLATSTELTLSEARKLFRNGAQLARNLDLSIPPLVASLEDTSKSAGITMKTADSAIERYAGANSPVRIELIKALSEFSTAARSFRVLTEYLENHPEALIKGKGKQ